METVRSCGSEVKVSRTRDGVEGMRGLVEVEEDNWSREGVLRNRGLTMADFCGCCRLSRDAAGRKAGRMTGSLDGRGMPDGRETFGGCSMVDWWLFRNQPWWCKLKLLVGEQVVVCGDSVEAVSSRS